MYMNEEHQALYLINKWDNGDVHVILVAVRYETV